MKHIFKLLILVGGFLFSGKVALADHLVGGEFRITAQGNFQYQVALDVYGDVLGLGSGNQDSVVTVSTFSKQTNALVETFSIPLVSSAFVPYANNNCQTGSIQTKILMYRISRQLPPALYNNPQGYYLVWERCCRNFAVQNVISPNTSGTVYYAEFPAVINNGVPFVNSSPALPAIPPEYLCASQPYQYSMAATDPDGDSLVYTLSEPMKGNSSNNFPIISPTYPAPYLPVDWMPGYGLNAMIPGTPALGIHPGTGLLSVTPATAGLFVFAFTCAEYRNGVKIGEVRRDMQVKINNCPVNNTPIVQVRPPGSGQNYQEGDTIIVSELNNFCYNIRYADWDVGQVVTVKVEPIGGAHLPDVSPSTGTVMQSGTFFIGSICWDPCRYNNGNSLYKVNMIVTDNACIGPASDTLQLTFKVVPKVNLKPVIRATGLPARIVAGQTYRFQVTSSDAGNDNLQVSLQGLGFNPVAAGMHLSPLTGKGQLVSEFSWTPTCEQIGQKQTYGLQFIVRDQNPCFPELRDTLTVNLQAAPAINVKPEIVVRGNAESVNIGKAFNFQLVSTDADNDQLMLRMEGIGFDPAAEGMKLNPLTGKGNLVSDFSWSTTCTGNYRPEGYVLNFILADSSCFSDHTDTVSVRLRVMPEPEDTTVFLPPNIFTPNSDGQNDAFIMPVLPPDNCTDAFEEIRIYSRWGMEVFKAASRNFSWNGNNVSDGTYFYLIRYKKKRYKGYVNLVR